MFGPQRAGKQHRRMRARVSVGECARGAALDSPARTCRRCQTTREPCVITLDRSHEANEIAPGRGGPVASIHRARGTHHQVRDTTVVRETDLAELEDEESFIARFRAERCVHFWTTRACDARENAAPAELLPDRVRGGRVPGLWEAYFSGRFPAVDAWVTLSSGIDHADSLRDDARVDGNCARQRTQFSALASQVARREPSSLSRGQGRSTTSESEKREIWEEMAHLVSRRAGAFWAGPCGAKQRRLGGMTRAALRA